jgi:pimeloyl-ACP methyl ester carboxylesterase
MTDKTALIFVPGLLCDEALWAPQMAALADIAACSVADTRRDNSIAGMAKRLLDAAPARFALAGLSMGGYVALETMFMAPERVERLALLDTSAHADTPERSASRQALVTRAVSGPEGFAAVVGEHLPNFIHPDRHSDKTLWETIRASAANVGVEAYARQQKAIIERRDQRPNLGRIKCPTLVLCGRQDALTPLALHEEIAAGIPGSTLEVIEHCGHLATLERPDAVNAAMRNWLETSR